MFVFEAEKGGRVRPSVFSFTSIVTTSGGMFTASADFYQVISRNIHVYYVKEMNQEQLLSKFETSTIFRSVIELSFFPNIRLFASFEYN